MKSNFYGNRKSLLAVFICAAFLSGSHVAYAVNESLLVSAYQQPSKIKGTVIDANGEVVIGASVVVKGTANGTITDIDGNFILSDVPTNGTIQVSFVGYKTLEIPVKGQTSFSLTLMDDTEVLDEVVVVGYGTMKKSDLTGSVGSISSEKLAARGTTRSILFDARIPQEQRNVLLYCYLPSPKYVFSLLYPKRNGQLW